MVFPSSVGVIAKQDNVLSDSFDEWDCGVFCGIGFFVLYGSDTEIEFCDVVLFMDAVFVWVLEDSEEVPWDDYGCCFVDRTFSWMDSFWFGD